MQKQKIIILLLVSQMYSMQISNTINFVNKDIKFLHFIQYSMISVN